MKHLLQLTIFATLPALLPAQEARLSITAENVEVELVSHTDGAAFRDESKLNAEGTKTLNSLEISQPATDGEWQPLSLTFKAKSDTTIILQLGGGRGGKPSRVLFDQVEATNATIENGDFEAGAARAPRGWRAVNWSEDQEHNGQDASLAASGTGFARVTSRSFLSQSVSVPKDTEVTITTMIRAAAD